MNETVAKAFEFAQETTKQLLLLATGILALTITFLKDIADGKATWALEVAWVLYLFSVLCGILTQMTLAGNLERPQTGEAPSIYAGNIKAFAMAQSALFLAGLVFTVIFGFQAL